MAKPTVHSRPTEFCVHQHEHGPVVHNCLKPPDHKMKHECTCGIKWSDKESSWPVGGD